MAPIARLVVDIVGNTRSFDKSLDKSQTRMQRFQRQTQKTFAFMRRIVVGAAVLAAGALVGTFVKGLLETERALREVIHRANFGVVALQVLAEVARRAGSEDPLEAIVDTSQELQLQLGEIAETGTSRALPALQALGLEAEALQRMSPEDAWRRVVEALQQVPNAARKAFLAEEIFGGSSEKLAGVLALTNEEFAALEEQVRKSHNVFSEEQLDAANDFRLAIEGIQTAFVQMVSPLAETVTPALAGFMTYLLDDFRPDHEEVWENVKNDIANATGPMVTELQEFNIELGKVWDEVLGKVTDLAVDFGDAIGVDLAEPLHDDGDFLTFLGGFRDKHSELWDEVLGKVTDLAVDFGDAIGVDLAEPLHDDGDFLTFLGGFRDKHSEIWDAVLGRVDTAVTDFGNKLGVDLAEPLHDDGDFLTFLGGFRDKHSEIWDAVLQKVSDSVTAVGDLVDVDLAEPLKEDGNFFKFLENFRDKHKELWDGIVGTVSSAVSSIFSSIERVNNAEITTGFASRHSLELANIQAAQRPPFEPADPGFRPRMRNQSPAAHLFAQGGIVRQPTLGVVGEKGPEAVIPLSELRSVLGGTMRPGGDTYTYNFNFPNYVGSKEDLKRIINDTRVEYRRRGNSP